MSTIIPPQFRETLPGVYERITANSPLTENIAVSYITRAREIRTRLGLYQVVIHPTRSAAVAAAEGEWFVEGPFTPKPKLTTGAGDNFNAGYCNGLLSGLDPEACLVTGVCSSGFYVRNCRSATRPELVDFIHSWAEAGCGEMP